MNANGNANDVQQLDAGFNPDAVTTSVLKTLKTQTQIGSTVDPKNGDTVPSGISYESQTPYGQKKLVKGDLLLCNYADKSGTMGNGTTEEVMKSTPGSKPATFLQSASLKGCSSLSADSLYGGIYTSDSVAKNVVQATAVGKIFQTITGGMSQPYGGVFNLSTLGYPPGSGYWAGDATSGTMWRIDLGTQSGKPTVTGVVTGFKVNKGKPGSVLGPTAMSEYQKGNGPLTMYVADGASNIVYQFTNAYNALFQAGAVKIGSTGKTFSGPQAKVAKVLYSGGDLKAPICMTTLPNGNLVVANSTNNTLVEIDTAGKVLATLQVDKGAGSAIRSIVATGSATATVIYFTDANSNTVQRLSK
ncbi:MAG TPA: hypothetical protein VGF18_10165 [Candidatus Tumulicola sp.]